MTRKIDKGTGEIIKIKQGGLYSPLPVPAYRVLGNAGEYDAQKVLLCLVAHLGSNGNRVWPSYSAITQYCGIHRSLIRKSLDVLEEFGFIKVFTNYQGKKKKNVYIILDACYRIEKFNAIASKYKITTFICRRCVNKLSAGEFKEGPLGRIHLGCGGLVRPIGKIKYATVI